MMRARCTASVILNFPTTKSAAASSAMFTSTAPYHDHRGSRHRRQHRPPGSAAPMHQQHRTDVFSGSSDEYHHGSTANQQQQFIGGSRRHHSRFHRRQREQSEKQHQPQPPTTTPTGHHHSIGGEDIVGASPDAYRMVDADGVFSLAEEQVVAYLRRQGQGFAEPMVIPAPSGGGGGGGHVSSNRKLAILVIELPSGQRVQATGNASRRDTAVKLCYMHAQELIDHFSIVTAADSLPPLIVGGRGRDKQEAQQPHEVDNGDADEEISSSSVPLPLALREVEENRAAGNHAPSAPLLLDNRRGVGSNPTEQQSPSRDAAAWETYVDSVASFLKRREQLVKSRAFSSHNIPHDLGAHPIHDLAAEGMRHWRGLDPLSVTRLHNILQNASSSSQKPSIVPEMTFVRAMGVTVATIPLGDGGTLYGLGVGRNKKDARVRCSMHALEIIRIRETMAAEATHRGGSGQDGGGGGLPAHMSASAMLLDSLNSLSPSQQRLLEGYLLLSRSPVRSSFRKESPGAKGGTSIFVCLFEIGELKCEGRGINRTEAERAAALIALDELAELDSSFQRIHNLVQCNTNFQPSALQQLDLAPDVLLSTKQCIKDVHETLTTKCCMELGTLEDLCAATQHTMLKEHSQHIFGDSGARARGSNAVVQAATSSCAAHKSNPSAISDADAQKVLHRFSRNSASRAAAPSLQPRDRRSTTSNHPPSAEAKRMQCELENLHKDPRYLQHFHPRRSTLAMSKVRAQLMDTMSKSRVVIVCGTTGCGKTTQVPQYIFDNEIVQGRGDTCSILISQPRRISAYSIAERIAAERLQSVGQDIGYSIRLDSKPGSHVTLCTTGIVLQMFVSQPLLPHVTHLIIDEIHERDINGDVALALAKELLKKNPYIKIILMSATLDSEKFSSYFDGAPIISIEGQTYPVEELYLEDVAEVAKKRGFHSPRFDELTSVEYRRRLRASSTRMIGGMVAPPKLDYNLVAFSIDESIRGFDENTRRSKSILVFLPGWKELLAAKNALEMLRDDCYIILLHSTVEAAKQKECFQPPPSGKVKVVLATNIAESGITIDDAAVVIDTGLIKLTSDSILRNGGGADEGGGGRSDAATAATQLSLIYGSRANCTQRRGRAGRTQGGVCIRLFGRDIWDAMPPFLQPEILRTPLEQVVLRLLALGYRDPQGMLSKFVDPPNRESVQRAIDTLLSLDAIEPLPDNEKESDSVSSASSPQSPQKLFGLSTLGLYLSLLPCEPRVGKMIIVGALLQCLDTVLTLASSNDVQPFIMRREIAAEVRKKRFAFAQRTQSDHIALVNAYNCFVAHDGTKAYANHHLLNWNNMTLISKYKEQFAQILCNAGLVSRTALTQKNGGGGVGGASVVGEAAAHDSSGGRFSSSMWFVDTSHHSAHWNDLPLVKACLAACLYPNVALLDVGGDDDDPEGRRRRMKKSGGKRRLSMRLRNGLVLNPSKESACRSPDKKNGSNNTAAPEDEAQSSSSHWELDASFQFLYQGIFKIQETNQAFLTSVSPISPWAILLFAAPMSHIRYDSMLSLCSVNDWLFLSVSQEILESLMVVKSLFLTSMLRKYQYPMDPHNNRCLELLRAVCSQVLSAPVHLLAGGQRTVPLSHTKGKIIAPWASKDDVKAAELRAMEDDDGAYEGDD